MTAAAKIFAAAVFHIEAIQKKPGRVTGLFCLKIYQL